MVTDLRQKAAEALARARTLLAAGDEPSVRYACLELRFCIEYVTYDHLVTYLDEVADAALMKWTPKQVIDALLEVDPHADKTVHIAFGLEETPGVQAKVMNPLGEDRRFTGQWANANHNALGNFLHAPTLQQIKSGNAPSVERMLKKATEVADELTAVLASPVTHVKFGNFFELQCECGATIKGRAETVEKTGLVCRIAKCRATYDLVDKSEDKPEVTFRIRMSDYKCPHCGTRQAVGSHKVKPGATIECPGCRGRSTVAMTLVPVSEPKSGGGPTEPSAA